MATKKKTRVKVATMARLDPKIVKAINKKYPTMSMNRFISDALQLVLSVENITIDEHGHLQTDSLGK